MAAVAAAAPHLLDAVPETACGQAGGEGGEAGGGDGVGYKVAVSASYPFALACTAFIFNNHLKS